MSSLLYLEKWTTVALLPTHLSACLVWCKARVSPAPAKAMLKFVHLLTEQGSPAASTHPQKASYAERHFIQVAAEILVRPTGGL